VQSYEWSSLNNLQVGAFAEFFVKMELTMYGFQVYTSEVDDRGIDFVARHGSGPFLQVQVKSLRGQGYVFMEKTKFSLHEHVYLALSILREGESPELYLVPSNVWHTPDAVFVDRSYGEGLKSAPEWGINLSKKNMPFLQQYLFASTVDRLLLQRPA
jgi:hypothetical protein